MSSSAPVAEYFPNERTDIPGSGGAAPQSLPVAPPNARPQYMDPSTLYLTVTIGSGHSFADALLDSECSGPKPPLLSLVASFLSRRFTTQRVAYTADPAFRGQTTFTLPDMRGVYAPLAPPAGVIAASAEAPVSAEGARLEPYLAVAEPLKFLLLRHPPEGGPAVVAASARCDWRPVLVHGRLEHDLVLTADASDLTLGIVPLRLALSPLSAAGAAGSAGGAPAVPALVPAATVARRIAADQRAEHDRHTQQQVFARAWWLRLERRLPPPPRAPAPQLYARDEFGSLRLACTFVRPADLAEGCLDTALHAARFVRLMPHAHLSAGPSGERARHWRSVPAFLAAGAGSALEHALLLCSLLLGFGLDAYVATGTAALPPAASEAPPTAAAAAAAAAATGVASPYSWVVTVSPSTGAATFWDAVTGRTYACRRGAPLPFTALSSLFRHDAFYACLRPDAAPAELSYALAPPAADAEDAGEAALVRGDGCWFAFPQEAIRATGPVLPLLIQKRFVVTSATFTS
jgi:centrosomal protein CEP76